MSSIRYFNTIPLVHWPREAIYRRLGFRKAFTRLSPAQGEETERYIQDAIDLIRLQGAACRSPVRVEEAKRVVLSGNTVLASRNLSDFLEGCQEAVLMGATAGSDIADTMARDVAEDRMTRAVVLDAAASEMVDAALDWIMAYMNQTLRREGKALKKTRYSAGYGDLALESQRAFYEMLDLGRLDISMTDRCILIPEKSVTALTGVLAAS